MSMSWAGVSQNQKICDANHDGVIVVLIAGKFFHPGQKVLMILGERKKSWGQL
jgi:hypothetical protein